MQMYSNAGQEEANKLESSAKQFVDGRVPSKKTSMTIILDIIFKENV
jgi:hypothetical protein